MARKKTYFRDKKSNKLFVCNWFMNDIKEVKTFSFASLFGKK